MNRYIDDLFINGEYITTITQFNELISKIFGQTMPSKDKLRLQEQLICLIRDGIIEGWINSLVNVDERLAECFRRIGQTPDISDDEILSELASACGGQYNATVENASCFSLANSKCELKGEKYKFSFKFDVNVSRHTQFSFSFIIKKDGRDVFRAEQMGSISGVSFELAFSVPQYFEADYLLFVEGKDIPLYQARTNISGVFERKASSSNYENKKSLWEPIKERLKHDLIIESVNSYNDNSGIANKVIDTFFPVDGIMLGETTVDDVLLSPHFKGKYFQTDSGMAYTTEMNRHLFTHFYISHYNDVFPCHWMNLGFDWNLSFLQWISVLKSLGFKIGLLVPPRTKRNGLGNLCFVSVLMALAFDNSMEMNLSFNYGDKGYAKESPSTLDNIVVRSPTDPAFRGNIPDSKILL